MSVTITFDARPEKTLTGQGIISWYTDYGYLSDFLESNAVNAEGKMTYNGKHYEITFMPSEYWPKTLQAQADEANIYLGNPDDDGNYPIDGYVVEGKILFINGQAVEPR
jgi:hypothetical protein